MQPEHFYRQSAVVPYRVQTGETEILLITSIRRGRWIIPKGVVEPDLSPVESAASEALEEAGVLGHVYDKPLGKYKYEKWGGTCTVQVFLMEVTQVLDEWFESDVRERRWAKLKEAEKLVEQPALRKIIRRASQVLNKERSAE